MYYFYILQNQVSGHLYKGITNNLDRRIREHNRNKNIGSRGKGLWKLIYCEEYQDRKEARKREKYFKSGNGREILKKLIDPL